LHIKDLKTFLQKSYEKDLTNNGDYKIDKKLSGQRFKVWHNKDKNHTVISHRGTKGLQDVITDAKLAFGFKQNKRFEHAKKKQQKAEQKYANSNITTVGHSLGAKLAEQSTKKGDIITLNKAKTPFEDTKQKNQIDIRTQKDPISVLNNKNDITIKSTSFNPFKEHSTNTLNRIDQNNYVGTGFELSKLNFKPLKIPKNIFITTDKIL